ncbi:MAG: adenosine deaminase [Gemmatimonadales bacterium]|nr:adenosine deaminase [Gemmatimonadales bacterium]
MRDRLLRMHKAELHVHLDGSLRPGTMLDLAGEIGMELPASGPEALRRWMLVDDARNLDEYLARFEYTIALLQAPEAIERVAYEMVADAAADGVRYLEVRYCPALSTRQGLSMDDAIRAEWRGLQRGEAEFGVVSRIINCSLRHFEPALSVEIAEHSVRMQDHGVVGFDLAGGEAGRPPELHREAFDIAARAGLGITVHAGEAAGWESIFEAIHSCRAVRIGHGTRLRESPELLAFVRDRRICIEINITSNVQTHAVASAADHPVRQYFDAGIPVTLCTDSWLMSGVHLTDEYDTAHRALGFTLPELESMARTAFEHAFIPWPMRLALLGAAQASIASRQ